MKGLIDPSTGKPAHRCDYATRVWFRRQNNPDIVTTLAACEKCGLLYKTGREHLHTCDDLIDPYTGVLLWPGQPDRCPGNGKNPDIECCCDECDYYLECYPEAEEDLFAALMDKVAEARGEQLQAEAERLNADPDAAVPESVTQRIQETLDRAFEQ